MQLAAALGLEVAEASYQPDTRACLVRRYDRVADEQGRYTIRQWREQAQAQDTSRSSIHSHNYGQIFCINITI
nr:hypothetical protein [Halomonas endophytica]